MATAPLRSQSAETAPLPAAEVLLMLKALADDTRWRIVQALRSSDHQVSELVEQLQLSQNLVSYHLGVLRQAGFVHIHRSDNDGRVLFYSLDRHALQQSIGQIATALHLQPTPLEQLPIIPVVFLCTGNSVRSQMAEAWLRHLSHGIIPVASAGVKPQGIHPLTLVVMQEVGLDLSHHTAKGLDALEQFSFAIAISVCDYAREECQPFLRSRLHLHWSVPQPERLIEAGMPAIEVFRGLRDDLRERVQGLLNILPELAAQYHLLPPRA